LRFFFSSRRRHTRSKRDWSSDVCSSDLIFRNITSPMATRRRPRHEWPTRTTSVRSSVLLRVLSMGSPSSERKQVDTAGDAHDLRSEERRVGKEGGLRGRAIGSKRLKGGI